MALPVDFVVIELTPYIRYDGDGTTDEFNFSFWIDDPTSDLEVLLDGVVQTFTTQYTATKAIEPLTGGVVTMVTAPSNTAKLVIVRKLTRKRLTDFAANGSLHAQDLNLDFDKIVSMAQDLGLLASMSLQMPLSLRPQDVDNILPTPVQDQYLAWGANNNIVNKDGSEIASGNKVAKVTFGALSTPDSDTFEFPFQMEDEEGNAIKLLQYVEFKVATSLADHEPSDLVQLLVGVTGTAMAGSGTAQMTIRTTSLGAGAIRIRRLIPSTTGTFPLLLRGGFGSVTHVRASTTSTVGVVFL